MTKRRSTTSEAPLFAWGDALRQARVRRRILLRRAALTAAGILAVGITIVAPPRPRLVWNASSSAPLGLYSVSPGAAIEPGDMAITQMPPRYRMLAASRHYIPANVPLVKLVAAAAGDEICAHGTKIYLNGEHIATRLASDGKDRPMPWWSGCIRLRGRQLFLLMTESPASFDGRYFGVTDGDLVIGKARLLWRR
jgi:conjugative transfer signal peptidase TraF